MIKPLKPTSISNAAAEAAVARSSQEPIPPQIDLSGGWHE